jgi:hypothetical protein
MSKNNNCDEPSGLSIPANMRSSKRVKFAGRTEDRKWVGTEYRQQVLSGSHSLHDLCHAMQAYERTDRKVVLREF